MRVRPPASAPPSREVVEAIQKKLTAYIARQAKKIRVLNQTAIKFARALTRYSKHAHAMDPNGDAQRTSFPNPLGWTLEELMDIEQAAKKSNKGLQGLEKAKKGGKRSQKSKK
jgi:hypothetical protein